MYDDMKPVVRDLDGRDVRVYVIGDVHIGSKECDIKGFTELVDKIAEDDDAYCVLVGDIINNATRSSVSNVYDELCPPSEQKKIAHDILYPIKDKILAAVMGNHEGRSCKEVDLDPMYDVFVRLGIEERYRKSVAFLVVNLRKSTKNKNATAMHYTFCLMHGKSATKRKKFAYALDNIDILCTGHTHEGVVEKPAHLRLNLNGNKPTVEMVEMTCVTASSWMNYGGYGARGMYMPQTTSSPSCVLLKWKDTNDSKYGYKEVTTVW